jgi:uncharacterized protein (TIGR02996 family)
MNEESTFLAAIQAKPDDDTVRLAYADWLEERGDPKGEFIRRQCSFARTWHEAVFVSGDPDCKRMEELEKEHGAEWLGHLPRMHGMTWGLWRGLPGWVRARGWQHFNQHAKRIFRLAPVEYVTFDRLTLAGARAMAKSPYLERIRVLDLAYAVPNIRVLRALLASPALKKLQTLRLQKNDLGDELGIELAKCPHISRLKLLVIYSNEIDDAGAFAIARSPHLKKVGFIDLSRNRFGDEAERALEKRFGDRVNV